MVNNLSLFVKQRYALFHNPTNYSLFISFNRSILHSFLSLQREEIILFSFARSSHYSFLLLVQKKRTKENTPSAHLPLKIAHVFGRGARRPPSGLLLVHPSFPKTFPILLTLQM